MRQLLALLPILLVLAGCGGTEGGAGPAGGGTTTSDSPMQSQTTPAPGY